MATTAHVDVLESTVQQTYQWLNEIRAELGWDDEQRAYLALRGTLHALRDHLVVDESAQFAAQLPMLVRGLYYEGWDPSRVPVKERRQAQFLDRINRAFARTDYDQEPAQVARAVLQVLGSNLSGGETEQVMRGLPAEVQELWNAPSSVAGHPASTGR